MDDPFHLWNQGEGGQIYTPVIRENHGWEEQTVLVSFADVGSSNTGKQKYMHGAHTQFPFCHEDGGNNDSDGDEYDVLEDDEMYKRAQKST